MRAIDITIDGITTFRVKDLRINHCPNEHQRIAIEGYVSDTEQEAVQRLALQDTLVTISASEEDRTVTWQGYVYDMELQHQLHELYLRLTLVSTSILMDREKKTRTFQKPGTKISEIIEYICKPYGAIVLINGTEKVMNGMLVQYQETDWEFLKRLASHLNKQVIVSKSGNIVLTIGLQTGVGTTEVAPSTITYKSAIQTLRRDMDYELFEADVETVIFESREIHELADAVGTDKGRFFIHNVESGFQKEELIFRYTGYRLKNYQISLQTNKQIIGASLNGKVHAVSGSKVQVDLDVDADNTLCGNKDFSYATVYSSDTGTGWYCMPEVGDTVRVYFPSDIERNAYAVSSVHLDVTVDHTSRSNPAIKSISNAQKKEIVFAPDGIVIKNTDDMLISLSDTEGINIKSNLPISIHSDMNFTLDAAGDITINGQSQLALRQQAVMKDGINDTVQPAEVLLKEGNITVTGVEFRLQENESS